MKAARPYPIVTITPKGERAIVDGHPWVYEGEVVSVSGTPEDGSLADVESKKGSWLGCGFYNSASKIRVRLVTRNANDDPADDITVTREFYPYTTSSVLDGEPAKTYTLEPGSRHYALPIPTVDIDRSKGELKQNTY